MLVLLKVHTFRFYLVFFKVDSFSSVALNLRKRLF